MLLFLDEAGISRTPGDAAAEEIATGSKPSWPSPKKAKLAIEADEATVRRPTEKPADARGKRVRKIASRTERAQRPGHARPLALGVRDAKTIGDTQSASAARPNSSARSFPAVFSLLTFPGLPRRSIPARAAGWNWPSGSPAGRIRSRRA
jgi:hypothetical protein